MKPFKEIDLNSLERLIPKHRENSIYPSERKIFELHMKRYQIATKYVKGKKVLDLACGVGYGSQILGLAGAAKVIGVDIAPEIIAYAQENYQIPQIEFICAKAEDFESSEPFDVIVSFETIEHLSNPRQFLLHLHSLLIPGGYLLLSSPLGETRHIDPYHLQAFTETDICLLLTETGFSRNFEYSCRDEWFLSRAEALQMFKDNYFLDPKIRLSWLEMFSTPRGWLILRDLYLKGGINVPQLLIVTKKS